MVKRLNDEGDKNWRGPKDSHQGAISSDTGAAQLKMDVWDIPASFSPAFELRWNA